ncbi:MAG: GIY-YIG nuclease family protein, partial [Parcubacteria group bacterium]|nr:GIY-YIG nuclease family protein [Parcubacteria group bacterium]
MGFVYVKAKNLEKIPRETGVYAFFGKEGLLYIGKAANLRSRIRNHFQEPSYRDNLFIDRVQKIGYLETGSEIEALLLESRLIKQRQPKYNVMWRDDKNYFYVAITKEDLPRVFLTHQPSKRLNYIGPFTEGKPIKLVLRSLREVFPYYTSKIHPKILCQYCHLGLCPGPAPDAKQYKKNIRNLVAVLQGKNTSVLRNLKKEMGRASLLEHYEAAGKLRDRIRALENVFSHTSLLSQRQVHEQNPVRDYKSAAQELKTILSGTRDIVRMEAYDISNIQGKETTGSLVVFVNGKPDKNEYRKFKIHLDGKPNDFAMMQELVSRRLSHAEWPSPDFMLIDGGKPQLTAALKALKPYKGLSFAVGALAKQNNELFLPGRKTSILLSSMSLALRNVLMHIRDEAHRFAISYHRKLHRKG